MTDCFLSEIDFDLMVDKKYLCLLTVFAHIEYCLIAAMEIVLEETKLALELKK